MHPQSKMSQSTTPPWEFAPRTLELAPGEVHLWRGSLSRQTAELPELWHLLSEDERLRASLFHFPDDSDRYVLAHGMLRDILLRYQSVVKPPLQIVVGPKGQPQLSLPPGSPRLMFSLSHSHSLAIFALVLNQRIGVDIEPEAQPFDLSAIAEHYFSAAERDVLHSKVEHARDRAFLALWTLKEAYAKALGEGLSKPPTSFSMLQSEDGSFRVHDSDAPDGGSTWSFSSVDTGEPFFGSLAVEGPISRILHWDWNLR
jgi:4'-phosphopantetheinyl transferase